MAGKLPTLRGLVVALASAVAVALALASAGRAEERVVATMKVTTSAAGASIGSRLVEGVMEFRGQRYLLFLEGVEGPATSSGSVSGLVRPRDVEGPYTVTQGVAQNAAGVRIRFDPPLRIREGGLKITAASRIYPRVSTGQGGSVE
jgi:hypothetical protein